MSTPPALSRSGSLQAPELLPWRTAPSTGRLPFDDSNAARRQHRAFPLEPRRDGRRPADGLNGSAIWRSGGPRGDDQGRPYGLGVSSALSEGAPSLLGTPLVCGQSLKQHFVSAKRVILQARRDLISGSRCVREESQQEFADVLVLKGDHQL